MLLQARVYFPVRSVARSSFGQHVQSLAERREIVRKPNAA